MKKPSPEIVSSLRYLGKTRSHKAKINKGRTYGPVNKRNPGRWHGT